MAKKYWCPQRKARALANLVAPGLSARLLSTLTNRLLCFGMNGARVMGAGDGDGVATATGGDAVAVALATGC